MMSTKFTPGPWHANWTRLNGKAIGFHVADETHGSIRPICEFYDGTEAMTTEEVEANARLIAAAPELLGVLERAIRRLEIAHANGDSIMREWIVDARAALAKATGDQS